MLPAVLKWMKKNTENIVLFLQVQVSRTIFYYISWWQLLKLLFHEEDIILLIEWYTYGALDRLTGVLANHNQQWWLPLPCPTSASPRLHPVCMNLHELKNKLQTTQFFICLSCSQKCICNYLKCQFMYTLFLTFLCFFHLFDILVTFTASDF